MTADNKPKRKTFISYYWPFLAGVFGPVVIYMIIVIVYALVTKDTWLLNPTIYVLMFSAILYICMILYDWNIIIGCLAFTIYAQLLSIPLLILLFGAIFSANKAKKAKTAIGGESGEERGDQSH